MSADKRNATLLVSVGPGEWRAAWVEDGAAVELHVERGDTQPPGSRHLGRVVRVVPALEAALVDIGGERPAFLPLRDVPEGVKADEGARLAVEVKREAWADKAPRVTARFADFPALIADTAALDPPVRLFPIDGFAAALALRVPGLPDRILVDDAAAVAELRAAFPGAAVERREVAEWPVDLDAAFDKALTPSTALRGGGAVHFAETPAATLVDVDTGTPEGGTSARAALAANEAASRLVAAHLRLRQIGGPVVIDFVGLSGRRGRRDHRERVGLALARALAADPAEPQILGWTRLGHLEMVRSRRGRSLADAMLLPASPKKRPATLVYEALRQVQREARAAPAARWRLRAAPEVAAVLRGPAAAALATLEARLARTVEIAVDPGIHGFDIVPV